MADNLKHLVGMQLGVYTLEEMLSQEGNLVATFRARQPSLKRDVAIQILNPDLQAFVPIFTEGFIRASEIMAGLEHANIAPIHDFGVHNNLSYIVTRLMQGGSLRQRVRKHEVTLQDAVMIVKQISSALDYAHSQGHVHGDPSMANIVFDRWGNAYIGDFHVSGFVDAGYSEIVGTPAFMAPERRYDNTTSPLTDQYALAKIIESVIKPLYAEDTEEDTQASAVLPDGLNVVFERALAFSPENRYPTASDFARAFERAIADTPQHLFISYSRRDSEYAMRLREHLIHNDFEVWIDSAIEHGDQWFSEINEAIKACVAFVVVMTPDAEQSEWVHKEILLAKRYQKPIFPLLRAGAEFPILIDIQFADVTDGEMPSTAFHRRLRRAVFGQV